MNKKEVIIIGGGTSGWISAMYLIKHLDLNFYKITLISSDIIGTIGVGESTIPFVGSFLLGLGISEKELLLETQGTIKLGIQFDKWNPSKSFIHPFTRGLTSFDVLGKSLAYWFSLYFPGEDYDNYSDIGKILFQNCKTTKQQNGYSKYDYAYHIDATLLAKLLKKKSIEGGVIYKEGVIEVQKTGKKAPYILYNGEECKYDFIIDCSGLKSQFTSLDFKNQFISFEKELLCNCAIFARSPREENIPPYTLSSAANAGWTWKIPLQEMSGNGYVFSDKFITKDQAKEEFAHLTGISKESMNVIGFKTGYYKNTWYKDYISIGLSSGFVEPLEATGLYFICKQLELFGVNIHNGKIINTQAVRNKYNNIIEDIYIEVKDFLVFHYATSQKNDTSFWEYYKNNSLFSQSFKRKYLSFEQNYPSSDFSNTQNLFKRESWIRIMMGQSWPIKKSYNLENPRLEKKIKKIFLLQKEKNKQESSELMYHKDFLNILSCADLQE